MKNEFKWQSNSVKIMHAINDITEDYATKYPVEARHGFLTEEEEQVLHSILDNKTPQTLKDIIELNEAEKSALVKLYDAFELKSTANILGKEQNIPDDKKIALVLAFWDENRTHFSREEERIVCLNAFRRLQYKTQVMVNSASDDQRTRLLHSLEVEKAAKKIAVAIGANWELASVIAVTHDIGHTPFGHAGERAINDYLSKNMMGRFAHALQGVKVLDKLSRHPKMKELGLDGIGLSKYVLEGVLKHDADSFVDDVSSAAYRLQYDCKEITEAVGCKGKCKGKSPKGIQIGSVESQIVAWADKIEYIGHDWEECIQFGLLDKMIGRINNIVIKMSKYLKINTNIQEQNEARQKELDIIKEILEIINSMAPKYQEIHKKSGTNKSALKEFFDVDLRKLLIRLAIPADRISDLGTLSFAEKRLCEEERKNLEYPFFFSCEQYGCLFDFFNIVNAWVNLTNSYPKNKGIDFDIIYVFFDYLAETTSYVITPRLVECLINDTKKLMKERTKKSSPESKPENITNTRINVISQCNQRWLNSTEENEKDAVRLAYFATFSPENYKHIKTILNFINIQYIRSTRVQNMNLKAKTIITKLLDFYCASPEMLPHTFRNRIAREIACEKEDSKISTILKQYFDSLIDNSENEYREDMKKKLMEKNLYVKGSNSVNPDVVQRAIITRVVVDYIAGMTDRMAEMKYNEIISSSTSWTTVYGE